MSACGHTTPGLPGHLRGDSRELASVWPVSREQAFVWLVSREQASVWLVSRELAFAQAEFLGSASL